MSFIAVLETGAIFCWSWEYDSEVNPYLVFFTNLRRFECGSLSSHNLGIIFFPNTDTTQKNTPIMAPPTPAVASAG